MLPDHFNVFKNQATVNYGGQESEKQFAVCDSDTSVNLKQNQDHQTCMNL